MGGERRDEESVEEVEGSGACGRAQADGVPCTGTRQVCWKCRESGRPACECVEPVAKEIGEIVELMRRAGM